MFRDAVAVDVGPGVGQVIVEVIGVREHRDSVFEVFGGEGDVVYDVCRGVLGADDAIVGYVEDAFGIFL